MTHIRRARSVAIVCLALLYSKAGWASNVSVHPKRLVFEDGDSMAQVYLMNLSDKPATMRVSLRNYRMVENGQLVPIKEPGLGERFADPYVRYSPKRVRLQPGESQLVRIRVDSQRLPEAGEYRSHLAFIAEPEVSPQRPSNGRAAGEKKRLRIALTPVFGSSIPVIVRHGRIAADAMIKDVFVDERSNQASVRIALGRKGAASVYGDVDIIRTPARGKPILLGRVKGVGIYPPLTTRYLTLNVPADKRHHLAAKNELSVAFTAHDKPDLVIAKQSVMR